MQFDGTGDYVEVPDSASLDITATITVELWVNPTTLGDCDSLVHKINNYGIGYSFVDHPDIPGERGKFAFLLFHTTYWTCVNSMNSPVTGNWYHVVGTFDGTLQKIYVNGNLEGTVISTGPFFTTDYPLIFGGYFYHLIPTRPQEYLQKYQFNGTIDEVAIYNRALNAEEIKAHYERRKYIYPEPTVSFAPDFSAWHYNRSIYIKENSGNDLTDYQVLINLSGNNFPAEANESGADIRFADENENVLNYWIEEYNCSAKKARIWVRISDIPANGTVTLKMYWGNPSVSAMSDGDATFEFFDDFNDNNLDMGKWIETEWNGMIGDEQNERYEVSGKATAQYWVAKAGIDKRGPLQNRDYVIEVEGNVKSGSGTGYGIALTVGDGTNLMGGGVFLDTNAGYNSLTSFYNDGTSHWLTTTVTQNSRHQYKIIKTSSNTRYYLDDNLEAVSPLVIGNLGLSISGWTRAVDDRVTCYFDDIRVRKYTSPEPTVTFAPVAAPYTLSISENQTTTIGENALYTINVHNLDSTPITLNLSITGLNESWYTLSKTSVFLIVGEEENIILNITVPDDCSNTGTYPFNVFADSKSVSAELTVVAEPIISELTPPDSAILSSNDVLFSWRTAVNSTTDVYIKAETEVNFTPVIGGNGLIHAVTITNLTRNTDYEWYAKSCSACGCTVTANRTFYIDNGIVFTKDRYDFTVERDYDQHVIVSVKNMDSESHDVLVQAMNPYKDLIAGFVGNGSVDEILRLAPGETKDIEFVLHAQDAMRRDYEFAVNLTNIGAENITDFASVHVTIRVPTIDFGITEVSSDPNTLAKIYRITNYGDRITDLKVSADDNLSANLLFLPAINHANLGTGQSVMFEANPILSEDFTMLCGSINVEGIGTSIEQPAEFTLPEGKQVFLGEVANPMLCVNMNDWYCTNRKDIYEYFSIPSGFNVDEAHNATLRIRFAQYVDVPRPHSVFIYVNGYLVGSIINTIPTGTYTFEFDASFINDAEKGVSSNVIHLQTVHPNRGHYALTTDFEVCVCLESYEEYVVAERQDAANNILWNKTYLTPSSSNLTVNLTSPLENAEILCGTPTVIRANVTGDGKPALNILVKATFNNSAEVMVLEDDGMHDDGTANNGVYGSTWIPTNAGNTTITVTASNCAVSAKDSVGVWVIELPDLTLSSSDISFSNPNPSAGENITITATIHNRGDADAKNVTVQFFDCDLLNETQIGTNQTIYLIAAGGSETINVTWTAENGTHVIYVRIDPDGDITELDETNNEAHKIISIGECTKSFYAQQVLLLHLNYFWNYDFYEDYYTYDDNAVAPDPKKDADLANCTIPIAANDIWITRFSTYSPGFYPSSAAIMGPVIGVDTNSWYNWSTPVKDTYGHNITYPELELKSVDEWVSDFPWIGKDLEELLGDLLNASEFSIKLDGVYAHGPMSWDSATNRSSIPVKFSGKAVGPTGIGDGGNCEINFVKYYDIDDDDSVGDTIDNIACSADIELPVKNVGYNKTLDEHLTFFEFNGTVMLNLELLPSADAGVRIRVDEPIAMALAGKGDSNAELSARAVGNFSVRFPPILDFNNSVNISMPTPTLENPVTLIGETVVPIQDFSSGDYIDSVYTDFSGHHFRYEDLREFMPVFRINTYPIMINYSLCFNLTELNITCGTLGIPCEICLFDGILFSIDEWEYYYESFYGVSLHSPADLHLYDAMGRHIGPNATNGIDLEIPYSTYIVNDSIKRLLFPTTTGKFMLVLNGTDAGTYNMTVYRPILISDVNNTNIIKGITYRVENMPTNTGNVDYYNINFEEIERQVNKKVHSGENITDAINEAFDFIICGQDVTKHPTALFVSDAFGANGDQVVLYARLMSLDKPSDNRTIVFEMDDNVIGQAITDANGNVSLNYTIPDGVDVGVHQISAIFSGDDIYNGTRGYALLTVLNQPPKVILELPGVMLSGTVLVNGTVTDTNLEQVLLEIDGVIAADSIPYLWDTTNYTDGLHTVKLIGTDRYGEKGQSMAFVIVDNTLPTITNVSATNITPNSATITWDTDEPSDSMVKYGTESVNDTLQNYDPENVTAHRITLTGLLPNATYYYVVNSTDQSGNTNECSEHYFITTEIMCGDVNGDGAVDMSDVIDLLYYAGYPGQYTICSEWSADVNCDGHRDMSDVRALLYYVGYPEQYALKCCYSYT